MSDYGLPIDRTGDDNTPDPVEHTYEWNGEPVTIELVPPTLGQIKHYEDLGGDTDVDELEEIVDTHITKPELPAEDMTLEEINCYIEGILDHGQGGGSDMVQNAEQYIDEHAEQGNAPASSG